jgi:hypothetical protein
MGKFKIKDIDDPSVKNLAMEEAHKVSIRVLGKLFVRLPLDPDHPLDKKYHEKDKFTLSSTDGSYGKTLTLEDDKIPGNKCLDLEYKKLDRSLSYTLTIDHTDQTSGGKKSYKVFEGKSYKELNLLSEDLLGATAPQHYIDLTLCGDDGIPVSNQKCRIIFQDDRPDVSCKTDADGKIHIDLAKEGTFDLEILEEVSLGDLPLEEKHKPRG